MFSISVVCAYKKSVHQGLIGYFWITVSERVVNNPWSLWLRIRNHIVYAIVSVFHK